MTSTRVLSMFLALSAACAAEASPEFSEILGEDQPKAPKLVVPGRQETRQAQAAAPGAQGGAMTRAPRDPVRAPQRDKNGLPLCTSDGCPQYDGKRCREMGFRPDRFCEPQLVEDYAAPLADVIATLRLDAERLTAPTTPRDYARGKAYEIEKGYHVGSAAEWAEWKARKASP